MHCDVSLFKREKERKMKSSKLSFNQNSNQHKWVVNVSKEIRKRMHERALVVLSNLNWINFFSMFL